MLVRAADGICETYGAKYELDFIQGAPAIINAPEVTEAIAAAGTQLLTEDKVHWIPLPSMGSEDFSHYLQHVPFEGLGSIGPWLKEHGAEVTSTRLHRHETLPAPDTFDWLVVLGGPMGVRDVATYPWLTAERRFVLDSIEREKTVLGVCLGAQIIAAQMQQGIKEHGTVAVGKHETVTVAPLRIAGIVLEVVIPQHLGYIRHPHGRTGMS